MYIYILQIKKHVLIIKEVNLKTNICIFKMRSHISITWLMLEGFVTQLHVTFMLIFLHSIPSVQVFQNIDNLMFLW